jgi:antitoxin component of MazEF toxin-antitoxin module
MNMEFIRKIIQTGTSKGIVIPTDVLSYLELEQGDDIVIAVEKGKKGKYISMWKKEE